MNRPDDAIATQILRLSTELESTLSRRLGLRAKGLGGLISPAFSEGLINNQDRATLFEFVDLRNGIAHGRGMNVLPSHRNEITTGVERILRRLSK